MYRPPTPFMNKRNKNDSIRQIALPPATTRKRITIGFWLITTWKGVIGYMRVLRRQLKCLIFAKLNKHCILTTMKPAQVEVTILSSLI